MPATMCSYLMWEKRFLLPPIFLGEIVADETVDVAVVGGGIVADGCFIAGDDISLSRWR